MEEYEKRLISISLKNQLISISLENYEGREGLARLMLSLPPMSNSQRFKHRLVDASDVILNPIRNCINRIENYVGYMLTGIN